MQERNLGSTGIARGAPWALERHSRLSHIRETTSRVRDKRAHQYTGAAESLTVKCTAAQPRAIVCAELYKCDGKTKKRKCTFNMQTGARLCSCAFCYFAGSCFGMVGSDLSMPLVSKERKTSLPSPDVSK